MAEWHLTDIENALHQAGWRIVARHPGNDRNISGTWELQRSTQFPSLFLDFDGLDDMQCLPMDQVYACQVRNQQGHSLYFFKKGTHWLQSLRDFVQAFNTIEIAVSEDSS